MIKMIHFSKNTLTFLSKELQKNYEICASLDKNAQDEYEIKQYSGDISIQHSHRGMCEWSKITLTPVILHTHPIGTKSYPSKEDYSKVWKDKYVDVIQTSLIITPIGIFQMINTKYKETYKTSKNEINELDAIIKLYTDEEFYPEYKNWEKGILSDKELQDKYKTITDAMNMEQSRFKLLFYPN